MALRGKKSKSEFQKIEPTNDPATSSTQPNGNSRNIVICCDGTGNVGGAVTPTNVWRIRQALAQTRIEGEPEQLLIYQDGVGTSAFQPLEILGKAVSYGITSNLEELYGRLVHMYQPGDRIYLFGFSRGAFTARLFANLLYRCGLASPLNSEGQPFQPNEIRNLAGRAVEAYKMRLAKDSDGLAFDEKFRMTYGIDFDGSDGEKGRVPIEFMGLWDTVAAVGFPFEGVNQLLLNVWSRVMSVPAFRWAKFAQLNFHRSGHWTQWRDDDLHPKIRNAYHALSIDDERQAFRPVLWTEFQKPDEQTDEPEPLGTRKQGVHVEQVWFSGMHANVGGGYAKDELAYVSLNWIMEKAANAGLRFEFATWEHYLNEIDALGQIADSRSGLATYYRYKPRQIAKLAHEVGIVGMGDEERLPAIHDSVFHRIDKSTDSYAPIALPVPGAYREIKSLPSDKHPTTIARTSVKLEGGVAKMVAEAADSDTGSRTASTKRSVRSVGGWEQIVGSSMTTEELWRSRRARQDTGKKERVVKKEDAGNKELATKRSVEATAPPSDEDFLDQARQQALDVTGDYIGLRRCLFYLFFAITIAFLLIGLFGSQPGKLAGVENAIYSLIGFAVDLFPLHPILVIIAAPLLIGIIILSIRSWMRSRASEPPTLSDPTPFATIALRGLAFMALAMILRPLAHEAIKAMVPVAGAKLVGVLGSPAWFALFVFVFYLVIKFNSYCRFRMHEWSRYAWRVALGKTDEKMPKTKTDQFAGYFKDPLPDEGFFDRWVVPFVAFVILGGVLAYPIWITVHDALVRIEKADSVRLDDKTEGMTTEPTATPTKETP